MTRHPEWLTAVEVAARLRVTQNTVYTLNKRGLLPQPVSFGRRCLRWRKADVERFIAEKARAAQIEARQSDSDVVRRDFMARLRRNHQLFAMRSKATRRNES